MPPRVVVLFGYHDREAPRQWNLSRELKTEGFEIIECHTTAKGFLRKCTDLKHKFRSVGSKADAVLVTFPGQYLVPLAWLLTRRPRKKLIFDAFVSLHDSIVTDRGLISSWSPYAWFLYAVDWLSCHLADEVLIDTEAHRKFFIERFHLRPERIRVIYLDARTDLFHPADQKPSDDGKFHVTFYGSYIPLQGVEYILDAAAIVQAKNPAVSFTLIGSGQTYATMKQKADALKLQNVSFIPFVPLADLPAFIQKADLCLGIFGLTPKAQRVIPHKVYDAVACGVPIVTEDSPAIRERFASHPLVILCAAGEPECLARVILTQTTSRLSLHTISGR